MLVLYKKFHNAFTPTALNCLYPQSKKQLSNFAFNSNLHWHNSSQYFKPFY